MRSLLNKLTSTVAKVVLVCAGCAMAGLGLAFLGLLTLFALAAAALALLVSPFVALARPAAEGSEDRRDETVAA